MPWKNTELSCTAECLDRPPLAIVAARLQAPGRAVLAACKGLGLRLQFPKAQALGLSPGFQ
ncbi:hypothetical protein ARMGADRAFT_527809 [Armillaria gallica]|uniref:Uncharacterized protein n=1 Tax=Armillaria gallica TaxID=47427 RepID=A0A2H3DXU2_ARMGA|nr:hypothetical protein ARMGADRAFT_527809 [Armillaria gallica]